MYIVVSVVGGCWTAILAINHKIVCNYIFSPFAFSLEVVLPVFVDQLFCTGCFKPWVFTVYLIVAFMGSFWSTSFWGVPNEFHYILVFRHFLYNKNGFTLSSVCPSVSCDLSKYIFWRRVSFHGVANRLLWNLKRSWNLIISTIGLVFKLINIFW